MSLLDRFSPKKPTQFWGDIESFKKNHKADIMALQQLRAGTANEMQQKRALAFIINYLCRTDQINFFSDPCENAYMGGREAVGKVLRGLALDSDYIDGDDNDRRSPSGNWLGPRQ